MSKENDIKTDVASGRKQANKSNRIHRLPYKTSIFSSHGSHPTFALLYFLVV